MAEVFSVEKDRSPVPNTKRILSQTRPLVSVPARILWPKTLVDPRLLPLRHLPPSASPPPPPLVWPRGEMLHLQLPCARRNTPAANSRVVPATACALLSTEWLYANPDSGEGGGRQGDTRVSWVWMDLRHTCATIFSSIYTCELVRRYRTMG